MMCTGEHFPIWVEGCSSRNINIGWNFRDSSNGNNFNELMNYKRGLSNIATISYIFIEKTIGSLKYCFTLFHSTRDNIEVKNEKMANYIL